MPGRMQHVDPHLADHDAVAFDEEPVELRAVALKRGAFVEHLAERVLHHGDAVADADLTAQTFLQIGRGREVVGVHMGFQKPGDGQPAGLRHGR